MAMRVQSLLSRQVPAFAVIVKRSSEALKIVSQAVV